MNIVKKHAVLITTLVLFVLVIIASASTAGVWLATQRITGQQTIVIAPDKLAPGTQAAVRAVVQDFNTGKPIGGAAVTVMLGKTTVFEGKTDEYGAADIIFDVPEGLAESEQLVVETHSKVGSDKLTKPVSIKRDYKLLLTTDKPLYQPGQLIHIRALALSVGDMRPATGEVEFIIADGEGNKVHRSTASLSEWGITSLDFQLASEVNQGAYKITAQIPPSFSPPAGGSTGDSSSPPVGGTTGGAVTAEKTIEVKYYVLPKFKIAVETEKPYYLPGETVRGTLRADYFFGKPVAESKVRIRGYIYAVTRQEVTIIQGETDEDGVYEFEFELPKYFVSGAPEMDQATFGMEIVVIDQAEHAETKAHSVPVAEQPLLIDAVAESGDLKPGVENIIYIMTSYPDGSPAPTDLTITALETDTEISTGEYGLAEYRVTPPSTSINEMVMLVEARDERGNRAKKEFIFSTARTNEYILLRPERAAYRVGDTMRVDAFTSAPGGAVFLDITRAGQTLSTRSLEVERGQATAMIDLDETMFGTLELHAYKVMQSAEIIADTRLVVVDRAEGIDIAITPDLDTYLPGENAAVEFTTTRDGAPIPAALGVSVVDEAVFALHEAEAGFAKLYFLLQAELLEPKYQIKWFSPLSLYEPRPLVAEADAATDTAARAALAKVPGGAVRPLRLDDWEKQNAIDREKEAIYARAATALTGLVGLLCAVGLLISIGALIAKRIFWKTLLFSFLSSIVIAVFLGCLFGGAFYIIEEFLYGDVADFTILGIMLMVTGAIILALLGGGILAAVRRDAPMQVMLLILLAVLVLMIPLGFTSFRGSAYESPTMLIISIMLVDGLLIGFYLRGIGYISEKRFGAATFSIVPGAVSVLITPLFFLGVVIGITGVVPGARAPQDIMLVEEEGLMQNAVEREKAAVGAMATPAPGVDRGGGGLGGPPEEEQEAPRLREYFPETLYWNPQAITGEDGKATLEIPMADSITTWRMSVLASAQRGEMGSADAGLRVFQDFFIDLDLPVYLTQNDEVSIPVAVFNYLPDAQDVRLVVEEFDWFELQDDAEKTLTITANDVEVVYFRIRAAQHGVNRFQVTAWGSQMSDAIAKDVRVMPDGKRYRETTSDNLQESVEKTVVIPETAIAGTPRIWVKVYPGIVSQIVDGLDGLFRMPFG